MNDYVVLWVTGMKPQTSGGVVLRLNEVLAFLHCSEDEAAILARDLGTELRYAEISELLTAVDGIDCPNECDHLA